MAHIRRHSQDLQQQAFVHVVKNCNQDTDTVIAIMEHTLRTMKTEERGITTAYYRHDNAGCYHSVSLLIACHLMEKKTGYLRYFYIFIRTFL